MNVTNRTIFTQDNLHILRGLESDTIDLIYLDPPFNSKHNYAAPIGSKAAGAAFKDTWTLDDIDMAWWGEIADVYPGLYKLLDAVVLVAGKSMMSYLIYMAVRIIEMRRILKPNGSLYLHCDPTASHYLKLVLDAVFGKSGYNNEIIWKRHTSHNDGKRFGKISDSIFFYAKTKTRIWNKLYVPYTKDFIKSTFKYKDKRGYFQHQPLTAEGLTGGGYEYEYRGHTRPWKYPKRSMLKLESEDRVYFPRNNGVPRKKVYLSESSGMPIQNIWTDIPKVSGKESVCYPTQKPLALLERIILSSSLENGVVLDPFCGCATACLAAERCGRRWIGIDISSKAYDLIKRRLKKEAGLDKFTTGAGKVIHRVDIPSYKGVRTPCFRDVLYGKQKGECAGCCHHFEYQHLEMDHIVPRAKGGSDADDNLQLLCSSCNRIKGSTRDMSELKARLKELGLDTCDTPSN